MLIRFVSEAVSYTHLDVYKRQRYLVRILSPRSCGSPRPTGRRKNDNFSASSARQTVRVTFTTDLGTLQSRQ